MQCDNHNLNGKTQILLNQKCIVLFIFLLYFCFISLRKPKDNLFFLFVFFCHENLASVGFEFLLPFLTCKCISNECFVCTRFLSASVPYWKSMDMQSWNTAYSFSSEKNPHIIPHMFLCVCVCVFFYKCVSVWPHSSYVCELGFILWVKTVIPLGKRR